MIDGAVEPVEFLARREALGLSQSQAAAILNVAQNTVSAWERGRRRIDQGVIDELDALEERVDDLFDQELARADDESSAGQEVTFVVYRDDRDLWADRPELTGIPAAAHRVAVALARRANEGGRIIENRSS